MKKIITIILALSIVFSCISAFAEESEGYKNALALVKSRIGNTDEYSDFTGHVNSNDSGTSYSFNWSNDADAKNTSVTVTESGVITRYRYNEFDNDDYFPVSEVVSKDVAKENALQWIKKINPDIWENILITDIYSDTYRYYNIDFHLTKNGFCINDNYGSMIIDSKGENVSFFNLNYAENYEFENGNIIEEAVARKAYKDNLGFELQYISKWNDEDERAVLPVYTLKDNHNKYISAITGEVIEIKQESYESYKGSNDIMLESSVATDSAAGGFSQAELDEFEDIELTISEKKAVDAVKNCKYFKLPEKAFEKVYVSTYNIDSDTRGYRLSFKWDENSAYAKVNAETGTILSFSKSRKDTDATITDEKASETAEAAFKYLAPDIFNEYKLGENDKVMPIPYNEEIKPQTASFAYDRYVNGIPFYDNNVTVRIDLADNSVINFSQYHSYIDFPSIENVVSYDEAADEYFNVAGFEPIYVREGKTYRLVYHPLYMHYYVDAVTGKIEASDDDIQAYSDVSGHYSEKYVNTLLSLEIGFNNELLNPDEPVKQKEFVALLMHCVVLQDFVKLDEDYNYDNLYNNNYYRSISSVIKNENDKNPDGHVTRLDAAKFTVCAMGYDEIGELDIYRPMFKDMEHAGSASILCGLGIMNGDGNGNFNPDGVLTRSQALIIIYNYLNQ